LILNPSQGIRYPKGMTTYDIINETTIVTLNQPPFLIIKSTTKEDLEGYCKYMNKHREEMMKKETKE